MKSTLKRITQVVPPVQWTALVLFLSRWGLCRWTPPLTGTAASAPLSSESQLKITCFPPWNPETRADNCSKRKHATFLELPRCLGKLSIKWPSSESIPVSRDGDGETVVFFPRVSHARHFGIHGETIPRFAVKLLQKTNTRSATTTMVGFHSSMHINIHLYIHPSSTCCLYLHYRKQIFNFIYILKSLTDF